MLPAPEPGLVIRYAYLWLDESLMGREEGAKDRPCAIVASLLEETGGKTRVLVLPITHTAPAKLDSAVEIPASVKKHLGLDEQPSWIILSESNEFVWPGADIRQTGDGGWAYGFLPPRLFSTVRQRFLALEETQRGVTIVRRTE